MIRRDRCTIGAASMDDDDLHQMPDKSLLQTRQMIGLVSGSAICPSSERSRFKGGRSYSSLQTSSRQAISCTLVF